MSLIFSEAAGIDGPLAKTLTALASTAAGATVGGTAGAGAAFNEVMNNYLTHKEATDLLKRIQDCNGNRDCNQRRISEAIKKSEERGENNPSALLDPALAEDVFWANILLANAAASMSKNFVLETGFNKLLGLNIGQQETANKYPQIYAAPNQAAINQQTAMNSWDGQVATSVHQATLITGVVAGPEILGAVGVAKQVIGGVIGGAFDGAGQFTQLEPGESYRPYQTVIAIATGAVAAPFGGASKIDDAFLGGIVGAANAAATNKIYGRNDNVFWAAVLGAGFGGLGNPVGEHATNYARPYFRSYVGRPVNPYPDLIGTAVSSGIGGIPSFIPQPWAKKGDSK